MKVILGKGKMVEKAAGKALFFTMLFLLLLCAHAFRIAEADWISAPDRGHVGWYGYEVKKKKKKKKKEKKKLEKKVEVVVEKGKKEEIKWPTPEELANMKSAEEIRKWLDKAADIAVAQPTVKNVERYVAYLHVVETKASQFASVEKWVMLTHPEYISEPLASSLPQAVAGEVEAREKFVKDVLSGVFPGRYAVLVFLLKDDLMSGEEVRIMHRVKEDFPNLEVRYFYWPDDREVFRKLGVRKVPSVWILERGGRV